jgi:IS30 family transposase
MARQKPIDRSEVQELRDAGLTLTEIARALGISLRTLQRRAKEDSAFAAALAGRPGPGWPKGRRRRGARSSQRHGYHGLKATLERLGSRALDPDTEVGRSLSEWREGLVADLGGEEELSTQQRTLIDVLAREKLLLQSIDAWLLQQDKLVNASLRAVYPVVQQRTELANAFSRRLVLLGLDREPWSS